MVDLTLVGYAAQTAQQYGIPENVFLNQLNQESGFEQYNSSGTILTSSAGALGVAQIEPYTAAKPGYGVAPVDPTDPYASIQFAAQYDQAMLQRTGSVTGMLEAYNAGLGDMSAGVPYAQSILGSGFASGVSTAANPSTSAAPAATATGGIVCNLPSWMQWLCPAVIGTAAGEAAITGQTVNGVTPTQGNSAIGTATGLTAIGSSITSLFSSIFSTKTGTPIAVAVLGLFLILGALFWLANSGKTTEIIQTANSGGALA